MAKLSRREAWAAKTGKNKSEYKASAEGRAVGKIKDYYEESEEFIGKQHKLDEAKLKKDFKLVLEQAGFKKDWIMEDFTRNMKRLAEDKATDTEELNYYLDTNRERTQEDLDTSLAKELRSYNLTMDREAQSLAERNLAFSGLSGIRGKEEGDITAEYESNKADYLRTAKRSFQDLERLETVKSAAIERQYLRDVGDTRTAKERGIQEIDFATKQAKSNRNFALDQLHLTKKKDLWDLDYSKDTDIALTESQFDAQRKQEQYEKPLWNLLMS